MVRLMRNIIISVFAFVFSCFVLAACDKKSEDTTAVQTEEIRTERTEIDATNFTFDYPSQNVSDPKINLKISEDEFLTDKAVQEIVFYAELNFYTDKVEVRDHDGNLICTLYDDGNYSLDYDLTGGDAVYTGKTDIDTSAVRNYEYTAVASLNGNHYLSNTKTVCVYQDITDADWADMNAVDDVIFRFLNSPEYTALEHNAKIDALIALLEDISVNGIDYRRYSLIIPGSIRYEESENEVVFLYACGLETCVDIEPRDYSDTTAPISD